MAESFYPHFFVSGIQKGVYKPNYAYVKPRIFVTSAPAERAYVKPRVFVTGADERDFATADTLRHVDNPDWQAEEIATADTSRRLLDVASADTLRQLETPEVATADTLIRCLHDLRYTLETSTRQLLRAAPTQSLVNSFKDFGVASFSVTLNERTLSDTFNLEIAREMKIGDAAKGMLLDYPFSFLVEETSQEGLIQSVKGMYDLDKLLYSHIDSSGTISYRNGDTEQEIAAITTGHIIYSQDEETTVICAKATEIIQRAAEYLGLTPNIKIGNFTPYNLSGTTNITYSDLISSLFSWTSRLPQRQINVFIRGGTLHCIQRGLEDSVVNISEWRHSRPTIEKKLIRSMYNNPFGSNKHDKKDDDDDAEQPNFPDNSEVEISTPFNGTIGFDNGSSSVFLKYVNGLLVRESNKLRNNNTDSSVMSEYLYAEVFPEDVTELEIWFHKLVGDFYLSDKATNSTVWQYGDEQSDTKKINTHSSTQYRYSRTDGGDVYLVEEYEETSKFEYGYTEKNVGANQSVFTWKLQDEDYSTRRTLHTPVGNGWYATSVYVDGEPQGSSLSQGRPGNKVSPYTINQVQKTFTGNVTIITNEPDSDNGGSGSGSGSSGRDYEDWRSRLSPIVDTSFPVREIDLLYELTAALFWLNRKTQETVSVDVIDKISNGIPEINHIVDFTERVILDGKEYFLVSNQIQFTPRKLIQRLQLVRWY